MKIVIDSNRVLAALIKDSTTREILFDDYFEFIAPDFLITEIQKYKERVLQAAEIDENEFEILLAFIFEHIIIISEREYGVCIEEAKEVIKDPKDIPYFAVCLAHHTEGIWTHDPDFKNQKEVQIFTNIDMLNLLRKIKRE